MKNEMESFLSRLKEIKESKIDELIEKNKTKLKEVEEKSQNQFLIEGIKSNFLVYDKLKELHRLLNGKQNDTIIVPGGKEISVCEDIFNLINKLANGDE